jgi:Bifunctional DNA primase/polymerase, N-terminal
VTGNPRLDAAVRYAEHGWPVFPCKSDAKEPATRHGVHDAETDPRTVARFWSGHPEANVAIATGAPGPTVLDVDVAHGKPGHQSLNKANRAGLVPAAQALVRTPSGGSHLYFQGDAQGNASMPRHGLDLRGKGGYVVSPPSTVGGRPYVVVHHEPSAAHIDFAKIREHLQPQAERPAWQPRDGQQPGVPHLADWVAGLGEGNRNAGTFWAACRAAEAGDGDTLAAIARAAVSTGLDQGSVDKTIASAQRAASPKAEPQREAG